MVDGALRHAHVGKGVARRETGWLEKKMVDFPYSQWFFGVRCRWPSLGSK